MAHLESNVLSSGSTLVGSFSQVSVITHHQAHGPCVEGVRFHAVHGPSLVTCQPDSIEGPQTIVVWAVLPTSKLGPFARCKNVPVELFETATVASIGDMPSSCVGSIFSFKKYNFLYDLGRE